jgi:hypothetical protein
MSPKVIVAAGALAIGAVFLFVNGTRPAGSPATAAASFAKAAQAGDLEQMRDLVAEGGVDEMTVEAANLKLQPVRVAYERAAEHGFHVWARQYGAVLAGGIEGYRRVVAEVNTAARSRFSSLSEAQREQAATPEGRRKWMGSIASEILGPEKAKAAGDLGALVDGQPSMAYLLAEGWDRTHAAEGLDAADQTLYTVDPFAREFTSRRGRGQESVMDLFGWSYEQFVTQFNPSLVPYIAQTIGVSLAPSKQALLVHCMRKGKPFLSRSDQELTNQFDPAKLDDRAFRLEQGRDYLSKLLKERYAPVSITVKTVAYAAQPLRFLKSDTSQVQLVVSHEGKSVEPPLAAARDRWRWKVFCRSLSDLPAVP